MTDMRVFIDRCCPVKLAAVIKAFEDDREVRYFDDDRRFGKDTDDVTWIRRLAQDEDPWMIVSMDAKILRKPHERLAITESGLPYFLLGDPWMKMTMHEKC